MNFLTFLFPLMSCFEPQPQYINTKDDNPDSEEDSAGNIQENQDDNTNGSTSEPDSGNNNSDNSEQPEDSEQPDNTEPDYQEPSYEPELPIYSGGYNVNLCSPEAQATGYAVGQVAGDFELIDQYGENLRLSDFCGNAVLLVAAAFW